MGEQNIKSKTTLTRLTYVQIFPWFEPAAILQLFGLVQQDISYQFDDQMAVLHARRSMVLT